MEKLASCISEVKPLLLCLLRLKVKLPKFVLFEIFWKLDIEKDAKNLTSKDIDIIIDHHKPQYNFMILKYCDLNQVKRVKFPTIRLGLYPTEKLEVMKYYLEEIVLKARPKYSLMYNEFEYLTDHIKNLEIHKYLLDFVGIRYVNNHEFEYSYRKQKFYRCCYWIKCGFVLGDVDENDTDFYKELYNYELSLKN
jgi:hypothetical protein